MTPTRREKKGLQTKGRLAQALKETLQTKPLDKIRIHHLTDRCGLYRQTFYYHFEDINSLLRYAAQEDGAAMLACFQEEQPWQARLEGALRFTAAYREYWQALMDLGLYTPLCAPLKEALRALLLQDGRRNPELVEACVSTFFAMQEQRMGGGLELSSQEMIRFFSLFLGESYPPPAADLGPAPQGSLL